MILFRLFLTNVFSRRYLRLLESEDFKRNSLFPSGYTVPLPSNLNNSLIISV